MKTDLELSAFPAERFAQAPSAERTRALLFRTGNEESLRLLERHDARIGHHTTVAGSTWIDGRLRIDLTFKLFLARSMGRRHPIVFETEADQVQRALPDKIVQTIRDGALQSFPATLVVTDELERTSTFLIMRRHGMRDLMRVEATTRIETLVPVGPADGPRFTPRFAVTLELDADRAATLADRRWEHYTVVDAIGLRTISPLPAFRRDALQEPAQLAGVEPRTP